MDPLACSARAPVKELSRGSARFVRGRFDRRSVTSNPSFGGEASALGVGAL
jgi:hypothetical protein